MEKAGGEKKKRKALHTNFSKAELLNSIPVEVAKELYAIELEQHAGPIDPETGAAGQAHAQSSLATRWSRSPRSTGQSVCSPCVRGIKEPKGQFKVAVHQLAERAKGVLLPDYSDNIDLHHTCGSGKLLPGDVSPHRRKPCITQAHIDQGTHAMNMSAQGCQPILQCPHCNLFFRGCHHKPACFAGNALEQLLNGQEQVNSVEVTFASGKRVRIDVPIL
jgi:hypothetical protein